jgi:hypothetical protein
VSIGENESPSTNEWGGEHQEALASPVAVEFRRRCGVKTGGAHAAPVRAHARPALSLLVEQIFPPLIVALAQQAHQMAAGVKAERPGGARQAHPGFLRRPASLAIVAMMAAGHQILPSSFALARTRQDRAKRPLADYWKYLAASSGSTSTALLQAARASSSLPDALRAWPRLVRAAGKSGWACDAI